MARQQVDFSGVSNPMLRFLLDDGTELNIKPEGEIDIKKLARGENK